MNLFPMALLLICLPFGISLQSMIMAFAFFYILITKRKHAGDLLQRLEPAEFRSMGLLFLVILCQIVATLLNPKNPQQDVVSFAIGFLPLVILPALFLLMEPLDKMRREKLEKIWAIVMVVWAILVFSQSIWGWKIRGIEFVMDDMYRRSQGFYSHPLTLAYVALMLWPVNLIRYCRDARNKLALLALLGNVALLYYSASRMAQAVCLLTTVGFILTTFRGRTRAMILASMTIVLALVFATPNQISKRFISMTTQISEEKESAYPDDRIAFWIVHWNMVKERPILGHGINLDRDYRLPYYNAIGLRDFKKAYEAHNQVLQLAAEGGIGAALAFLLWIVSLHFNWRYASETIRKIRDMTLICLLLGGLTQNVYFDGEVRFALMTLMAGVFALGYRVKAPAALVSVPKSSEETLDITPNRFRRSQ